MKPHQTTHQHTFICSSAATFSDLFSIKCINHTKKSANCIYKCSILETRLYLPKNAKCFIFSYYTAVWQYSLKSCHLSWLMRQSKHLRLSAFLFLLNKVEITLSQRLKSMHSSLLSCLFQAHSRYMHIQS